jgi:lysophospholipid acyltransferase (LPLAT)-like uncharacterized protein
MTRRSSCAFPVDGGGPYRQVGTGIVTLAASLRAAIVPLAAVVRPAVPSLHGSRVRVPLPRAVWASFSGVRSPSAATTIAARSPSGCARR